MSSPRRQVLEVSARSPFAVRRIGPGEPIAVSGLHDAPLGAGSIRGGRGARA